MELVARVCLSSLIKPKTAEYKPTDAFVSTSIILAAPHMYPMLAASRDILISSALYCNLLFFIVICTTTRMTGAEWPQSEAARLFSVRVDAVVRQSVVLDAIQNALSLYSLQRFFNFGESVGIRFVALMNAHLELQVEPGIRIEGTCLDGFESRTVNTLLRLACLMDI